MAAANDTVTVTANSSGAAVATITTRTRFQTWTVSQVSVEMPGAPIGASCSLRHDGALVTPLIPTGDSASGEPPVTLRPGEKLTVEFAGCTAGQTGTVYYIYDDGTPA